MQIHELNNYTGTLNNAYMAVDDGTDTGKEKIKDITDPLNARIDNIIAGGTAPSAAEITDARLGANGVTYPSLGDAIRDQITDINDEINANVGDAVLVYTSTTYQFPLSNGDTVTIEEAKGNDLPSAVIYMYSASLSLVGSISINSTYGKSRTLTLSSLSDDAKYVYLNTTYANGVRIFKQNAGALLTRVNSLSGLPADVAELNETIGDSVVLSAVQLYQFPLTNGQTITIEEAKGAVLPTATIYIYNAAKTAIGSISIDPSYGTSRTLTLSLSQPGEYLYIGTAYADGIRVYRTDAGNILTKLAKVEESSKYISPDVMGYITSTDDLYAVTNGSSWYFKSSAVRLFRNGAAALTLAWSSIVSTLSGYIGPSPDGTTECLVLSDGRYFYYCWDTNIYAVATNINQIPAHSTIILAVIGKQPYGVMWDYLKTTEIKRIRYNAVGTILTTVARYTVLLEGKSDNVAKIGFFSDPHWLNHAPSTDYSKLNNLMQECKHLYDSSPIDFVCCGGDWLNNGGTKAWALETLGYINGLTHRFKKFYNLVGNHDTNYIIGSELTTDEVKNALGVDYYSFNEGNTHYIALNSWTDDNYPETMDAHKWEQIAWLATELTNHENNIILLHAPIVKDGNNVSYVTDFADNITAMADAYNNQSTVTLNNITYDFSNASGKVWCLLGGHQHANSTMVKNNIPIFIIGNSSTSLNCYLTLVDYDNEKINFVSTLGSGSDWNGTL